MPILDVTDPTDVPDATIAAGDNLVFWKEGTPLLKNLPVSAAVAVLLNCDSVTVTLDDDADRAATAPDFVGQIAQQTRGGSYYVAHGLAAGDWTWVAYGEFTPATPASWTPSTAVTTGQVYKIPYAVIHAAGADTAQSSGTATIVLDANAGNVYADDQLNGCWIEITTGTGAGQKKRILDYVDHATTPTATVSEDWATALDATSVYEITWESGHTVYEILGDHTSAATFAEDLNAGRAAIYAVEDYHYMRRNSLGEIVDYEVWLPDASRADTWDGILDIALQQLQVGTATGPTRRWGSEFKVTGTVNVTNGSYWFEREVKWASRTTLQGPDSPTSQSSYFGRVAAKAAAFVTADGGTSRYYCIRTHEADTADNKPGTGTNQATYWALVAAWSASSVAYEPGDVVSRNGGADFFRCLFPHTSANDDFEPPDDGSVTLATAGDTWFRYWQPVIQSEETWADDSFYSKGWDVEYTEFLVRGRINEASSNTAHSVFHSGLRNLYLDCNSTVRSGVYGAVSQGSEMYMLDVDNFSKCGYYLVGGGDSMRVQSCSVMRLGSGAPAHYGWWVVNGFISTSITNPSVQRCEVAMSFGSVAGLTMLHLETENCGKPFEFRDKDHASFNYVAGTNDAGFPVGVEFLGCVFSRDTTDTYVVSQEYCGFVNYTFGGAGGQKKMGLRVQGESHAPSGSNPYDSIAVQFNGTPAKSASSPTFPLDLHAGYNNTGWEQFSFDFDLETALRNQRFLSIYTQTLDSRLVAEDNPATFTDNGTVQVNLLPGLYRIEVKAANVWDSGDITVKDSPSGTALPGFSAISPSASFSRYHYHAGGQMEVVVANVAAASADIDIYFRPWMDFQRGNESIASTSYPA